MGIFAVSELLKSVYHASSQTTRRSLCRKNGMTTRHWSFKQSETPKSSFNHRHCHNLSEKPIRLLQTARMKPAELRRHRERARYDIEAASEVFADCFMAHVAYVDGGLPQCLPMIALIKARGDETVVYLHGSPNARLMELVRMQEQNKQQEIEKGQQDSRIRVCITATKVDGLVLSSAPNGHTFQYRSSVIHGACSWEQDMSIKRDVMTSVTNQILPDRMEDVNPMWSGGLALVFVIKVEILNLSTKFRTGKPNIQPRNVEKDGPDHDKTPWTGVVPLYDVLGEPVQSGLTPEATLPQNLTDFVRDRNEKHKKHALKVAEQL